MAVTEKRRLAAEVADGVRRFDNGIVNWYLVEDDGRVAAIDSGFPPDWDALLAGLRETGHGLEDLTDVVLTHGHIDHIGFAERARVEAGATVHVHPADAPLLAHPLRVARSERLPLLYMHHPPTLAVIAGTLRARAPLAKRVRDHRPFQDGDILESVPGRPRVLFSPGHTNGHCALHLEDRGVLFSGDALITRDPYTGRTGPRLAARAATLDSRRAEESLDRLAETGARIILPGHGEPWHGDPAVAVRLAREAGAA